MESTIMQKAMVEDSQDNSPNQEEESKELAAKEFAREVKRLRVRAGLSQAALGALIGVEQTIITRIEKGSYGIDLDLVLNMAAAFHDNPHRLASIYWGIETEQFNSPNKRILDTIWDIIYPFYHPKIDEERKRQIEARLEEADRLAESTPDVLPPDPPTQPIVKPNSMENS